MVADEERDPDFLDIDIRAVREDEKVAAILICLNGGGTIRSLRECASVYAPISEHMVKKIIVKLQKLGIVYYDTKTRRWRLVSLSRFENIQDALNYVRSNKIHLI